MKDRAVHAGVEARPGEPSASLIRRFSRVCKKQGVHQVLRDSKKFSTFKKPSVAKRLKRKKAALRRAKEERRRKK